MGYPNGGLGDYINIKNNSVITDAFYSRMPAALRSFYRPKTPTVAAPVPVKIATVSPINILPPRLTPAPAPLISQTTASAANTVAPIVATAGGPAAAAAAVVPAITNALTQPPTEKVRVSAGSGFLTPFLQKLQELIPSSSSPAPAAVDTSATMPTATVYNADGTPANQGASVSQASAASGPDFLTTVKNLPPVALAAVAVGAYVLFKRK